MPFVIPGPMPDPGISALNNLLARWQRYQQEKEEAQTQQVDQGSGALGAGLGAGAGLAASFIPGVGEAMRPGLIAVGHSLGGAIGAAADPPTVGGKVQSGARNAQIGQFLSQGAGYFADQVQQEIDDRRRLDYYRDMMGLRPTGYTVPELTSRFASMARSRQALEQQTQQQYAVQQDFAAFHQQMQQMAQAAGLEYDWLPEDRKAIAQMNTAASWIEKTGGMSPQEKQTALQELRQAQRHIRQHLRPARPKPETAEQWYSKYVKTMPDGQTMIGDGKGGWKLSKPDNAEMELYLKMYEARRYDAEGKTRSPEGVHREVIEMINQYRSAKGQPPLFLPPRPAPAAAFQQALQGTGDLRTMPPAPPPSEAGGPPPVPPQQAQAAQNVAPLVAMEQLGEQYGTDPSQWPDVVKVKAVPTALAVVQRAISQVGEDQSAWPDNIKRDVKKAAEIAAEGILVKPNLSEEDKQLLRQLKQFL